MDDTTLVKVTNRNGGHTGYFIPDSGINRQFTNGESKMISLGELKQLSYLEGGDYLLKNALVIEDKEALKALNMIVEPEYFYTEEEIKDILLNKDLDYLEDTLNFGSEGCIDLIKKLAVELEIPDIRKRDMITKKTGFNVTNAINVNHIMAEETEEKAEETVVRKVKPLTTEASATPARKVIIKQ